MSSTTQSAIAQGTITATKENLNLSKINRDTQHSLNELSKIFDKKKLEERQELAQFFAKNADELLHYYDREGKFDKALAHGIVAEISSQLAGNKAGSGFAAGFTNEALINKIKEWAGYDPAKAQWISAALGATVNTAIGNNEETGADTAQYGTKWNAYREKPQFEGAYYANPDGSIYVRRNGQDIYVGVAPVNAYIWVRDANNPSMGWEYFKGQGPNGSDLYIQDEIVTGVYYIPYGNHVYGFALTQYTEGYKRYQIQQLGRMYAEAVLLSGVTTKNVELIKAGINLIENPSQDNQKSFLEEVIKKNF